MKTLPAAILSVLTTFAVGCGNGEGTENSEETGGVFLAFETSFKDYHDWESFDITDITASTELHQGETLTLYINQLPESGSEEFPPGTIIVKEATGDEATQHIFAMAKRGGEYNRRVKGWEWFELKPLDDHRSKIVWRGVGPPAGEEYGGDPNGACNTCHSVCPDGICSAVLSLDNF